MLHIMDAVKEESDSTAAILYATTSEVEVNV